MAIKRNGGETIAEIFRLDTGAAHRNVQVDLRDVELPRRKDLDEWTVRVTILLHLYDGQSALFGAHRETAAGES